jgi:hypothetical protein
MDGEGNNDQIGGVSAHVGDCYIWSAIHYLDSHTDYREFLPCNAPKVPPANDKLIMLDDIRRPRRFLGVGFIVGALLTFILLYSWGC